MQQYESCSGYPEGVTCTLLVCKCVLSLGSICKFMRACVHLLCGCANVQSVLQLSLTLNFAPMWFPCEETVHHARDGSIHAWGGSIHAWWMRDEEREVVLILCICAIVCDTFWQYECMPVTACAHVWLKCLCICVGLVLCDQVLKMVSSCDNHFKSTNHPLALLCALAKPAVPSLLQGV